MSRKSAWILISILMIMVLTLTACKPAGTVEEPVAEEPVAEEPAVEETEVQEVTEAPVTEAEPLTVGLLLVGPANDAGWSQAHFDSMAYVQEKLPGTELLYLENVYTGSTAHTQTPAELAADMAAKGAKVVIFNSDDQKDNAIKFAQENPDVYVIHASGDSAWKEGKNYVDLPNLKNIMGRMEYGKMMAGFAAAMTTRSGRIGYLGPLINEETRRLAASCYLGARYAWEKVLKKKPEDLKFQVTWIGFWFNIPGVTADPTQVAQNFFNTGFDVIVSGIDTTEAVVVARQKKNEGKPVWAIPYDYIGACEGASEVCLGVPYFNWGPSYVRFIQESIAGKWTPRWVWLGPDWTDINNPDTSAVGFAAGPALSASARQELDTFIKDLGSKKIELFKGPLNYQDGGLFLKNNEIATDQQIWYLKQLLQGMTGQSSAK